jgi:hypothetical protein
LVLTFEFETLLPFIYPLPVKSQILDMTIRINYNLCFKEECKYLNFLINRQ